MCIAQVVFGSYTKYIPLYIYTVLKAYPEYYVKIFVMGKLKRMEKKALELMPNGNFEIWEGFAEGMTSVKFPKYIRRIIPQSYFQGFKYVYHGDVDFIIIPETPPLHEQHLGHCKALGLPFSNAIRPSGDRISGLHFVIVEPYYKVMGEVLSTYWKNPRRFEKSLVRTSDEYHTLQILDSVFDLTKLRNSPYFRPEHGVHLALWRKSTLVKKTLKPRAEYFRSCQAVVRSVLSDPELWRVIQMTGDESLRVELTRCEKFFNGMQPDIQKVLCA